MRGGGRTCQLGQGPKNHIFDKNKSENEQFFVFKYIFEGAELIFGTKIQLKF